MIFAVLLLIWTVTSEARDILLKIPSAKPTKEDQYLCHGLDLKNETYYITGFEPKADSMHAHHILIYSCSEPGSTEPIWDCQEMNVKNAKPVCKSGLKLIYSWAMNAPGMQLPKDVSVMVGKEAGKQFLVLQNHYKKVDYFKKPDAEPDQSGIILKVQDKPTKKLAGLYLLVTDGTIPGHSTVFMEAACSYTGKIALHPFAFRTHTHRLGKLVSGYVVHGKEWKEIGKKSPQVEQMFYPVKGNVTINPGDVLASRCIMENKGDKLVKIGSTQKDEMCNFYIYYWVDQADRFQLYDEDNEICFTPGWPSFKWDNFLDPLKIPEAAAMLPGETNVIKEMINDMQNSEREMNKLMSEMFDEGPQDNFDNFENFQNENDFF